MEFHYLDAISLRSFFESAFSKCGVSKEDSAIAADTLIYADLNGLDTHGAANLERIYVPSLLNGSINPKGAPTIERDSKAIVVVNANNALGLVAGVKAMKIAIEKSDRYGIGAVAVRNSSHCGSVGAFTSLAAKHGMIGIGMTNMGPQGIVRPVLGREQMLGTNVISAAAPGGRMPPFKLDMSTAVVSTGQVRKAHRLGQSIPPGWLVDDQGAAVTDPGAFDKGEAHLQFLGGGLETGGAKGYGLAILVDILCGALGGAGFGAHSRNDDPNTSRIDRNSGHFFLALNAESFRSADNFVSDMEEMLSALKDCPPLDKNKPVQYPGLPEKTKDATRRKSGIPVPPSLFESLVRVSATLKIPPPLEVRK